MSNKKIIAVAVTISVLAALALGGLIYFREPKAGPGPSPTVTAPPPAPPEVPGDVGPEAPGEDEAVADGVPGEPAGPQPPRAVIEPLNAQNHKPVTISPSIGDIGRIFFHEQSGALILAVVEEGTKMRTIWKMSADGALRRVLSENDVEGEVFLQGDSRGRLYAGFDAPGSLYRSEDAGETWKMVATDIAGTFWQIADDGQGTLWGSQHAENDAILYRSTDDGLTWDAWFDFQKLYPELAVTYAEGDNRFKLRHLHGVIYHNGALFVGVGDVARFTVMTTDGGYHWKQIWDEGFTAAIVMPGGNDILFGPDRLQAHGIAYYDSNLRQLREVWSPIPYGYAGYTYSMIHTKNAYYVGFHTETNEVNWFTSRFGIITSMNGFAWYPFFEFGPVTHAARTDIFLSPGNGLIFMSMNGSLYAFDPVEFWWFDFRKPFYK